MDLLGSMIVAFSMYSAIPVPNTEWTSERMKYAMCFFPLVGVAIGGLVIAAGTAIKYYALEGLYVFFVPVIPVILTGGIHMDGFLDVTDARSSHQPAEKKLEILKDPHTGAFAIIGCCVYMLLYIGFFSELTEKQLLPYAGIFVMTRAFSAISVVLFKKAKSSGLAAAFSSQAQKKAVALTMVFWIVAAFLWIIITGGILEGITVLVMTMAVFFYYRFMSYKEFGGITGDLAGWFLQICELSLVAALVIAEHI